MRIACLLSFCLGLANLVAQSYTYEYGSAHSSELHFAEVLSNGQLLLVTKEFGDEYSEKHTFLNTLDDHGEVIKKVAVREVESQIYFVRVWDDIIYIGSQLFYCDVYDSYEIALYSLDLELIRKYTTDDGIKIYRNIFPQEDGKFIAIDNKKSINEIDLSSADVQTKNISFNPPPQYAFRDAIFQVSNDQFLFLHAFDCSLALFTVSSTEPLGNSEFNYNGEINCILEGVENLSFTGKIGNDFLLNSAQHFYVVDEAFQANQIFEIPAANELVDVKILNSLIHILHQSPDDSYHLDIINKNGSIIQQAALAGDWPGQLIGLEVTAQELVLIGEHTQYHPYFLDNSIIIEEVSKFYVGNNRIYVTNYSLDAVNNWIRPDAALTFEINELAQKFDPNCNFQDDNWQVLLFPKITATIENKGSSPITDLKLSTHSPLVLCGINYCGHMGQSWDFTDLDIQPGQSKDLILTDVKIGDFNLTMVDDFCLWVESPNQQLDIDLSNNLDCQKIVLDLSPAIQQPSNAIIIWYAQEDRQLEIRVDNQNILEQILDYKIYDAHGQLVFSNELQLGEATSIDLNEKLVPGLYFFTYQSSSINLKEVLKFVYW